ncbi:alanine racemase [Gordonia spumicola]|uniref:Alanine racemase n=1 Tax=Gordonia spumicola TaxID=589161 RepID=A0A7I9V988_9ACTN|nr:alanine racemase [Gordonia spumicola]GEE01875.1 alanine racemase [Gordonia spumicola]
MTTANLIATVDLDAVAHNVGVLRERSGVGVIAVVKADGYGHGAVPVASAALAAGASAIGTAGIREARDLRAGGIDGHLMAWLHRPDADFTGAVADRIDIGISSPRQLDSVVAAARDLGTTATVTVKVDTGLARSGVAYEEWDAAASAVARAVAEGSIELSGVMCHLVFGDDPGNPFNDVQAARLDAAVADLTARGAAPRVVHMANSPAALTRPDLARDLVRPGIALYGYSPIPSMGDFGLIPAMTLETQIALIKRVPAGQGVSYGHTWHAPTDTVLGVIPAGYADGVPRGLSGDLSVHVNGRLFPNVGRICMDQFVVDLGSDGGGVSEGDRAVLFGPASAGSGERVPTATDWADRLGTIDYEIVSRIGSRPERRYVRGRGQTQEH